MKSRPLFLATLICFASSVSYAQEGRDLGRFSRFLASPAYEKFLLESLIENEPASLKAECRDIRLTRENDIEIVSPPFFSRTTAHPTGGRWIDRRMVDRCGEKVKRNLLIDGGKALDASSMLPGDSLSSYSDQLKAKQTLNWRFADLMKCDAAVDVIGTTISEGTYPSWIETWTFAGCGRTMGAFVAFENDGSGNANFTVRARDATLTAVPAKDVQVSIQKGDNSVGAKAVMPWDAYRRFIGFLDNDAYKGLLARKSAEAEIGIPRARCSEPKATENTSITIIDPPEFVGRAAIPQKGSWIDHRFLDFCGRDLQRNILVEIKGRSGLIATALMPGKTLTTTAETQQRALTAAAPAVKSRLGCNAAVDVFSTRVLDNGTYPEWREIWGFLGCGKVLETRMDFKIGPSGTDFTFDIVKVY